MNDDEDFVFEIKYDSFADAFNAKDGLPPDFLGGRGDGSEQKRCEEANVLEWLAGNTCLEAFDIDGKVGELGHEAHEPFEGLWSSN
jgi:hypothetical protein